ncbi:unnamed protein product [Calypogeia fissa]
MPGVKMQAAQEGKHLVGLKVNSKSRKGWAKGKMEGKGGPLNPACTYRGVRQRQWGMWVAEIREPGKKKRLWLGTYHTADEAALIYDRASRQFYGREGYQNLCDFPGKHDPDLKVPRSNSERQSHQNHQQNQSVAKRAVVTDGPVLSPSSTSSLPLGASSATGSGPSTAGSSSSSGQHHLRPIRPGYSAQYSNLLQTQSSGVNRMVADDELRFNASSMADVAPLSVVEDYIAREAAWRLQMGVAMKTETEDEPPLEEWSDCSTSVTSATSPDSREYVSSMTSEEEPAWESFPEILSLPNDLELLDEGNLIYFPSLA